MSLFIPSPFPSHGHARLLAAITPTATLANRAISRKLYLLLDDDSTDDFLPNLGEILFTDGIHVIPEALGRELGLVTLGRRYALP